MTLMEWLAVLMIAVLGVVRMRRPSRRASEPAARADAESDLSDAERKALAVVRRQESRFRRDDGLYFIALAIIIALMFVASAA